MATSESVPANPQETPAPRLTVRHACRFALFCSMGFFFYRFLRLAFMLYDQFAYMTFDLGIFDQAEWLISHGHTPFVTARGIHILGDHFSVILYLIAPLYRLFPGPKTLLALQALALTLGAIPAYALARKRTQSELKGLLFGSVYLLYPANQWSITYEFHPDTFATPLLFAALYALEAKRFRLYTLAIVLTALIKESAGVTLICLGMWAFFSDRKAGMWTALLGAVMLPLAMLTVRHFNNGHPSPYFAIFHYFGTSPTAVFSNFLHSPLAFLAKLLQIGNLYYLGSLLLPLCFLPLLAPEILLLTTPMLLINFMADRPGMHTFEEYYNAFISPFLFLGAMVGFQRMEKWRWFSCWLVRLNLPLWALTGIILGPFARPPEELYSTRPPAEAVAECRRAISLIAEKASVSAQMALGAHLSQRVRLYTFPNPFVNSAYGGTRQALHEIDSVTGSVLPADLQGAIGTQIQKAEYVVLCPRSNPFPLSQSNYIHCVVALLQSKHYETFYLGAYVIVLKRTALQNVSLKLLSVRSGMPVETPKEIENAFWHWLALQYPAPRR